MTTLQAFQVSKHIAEVRHTTEAEEYYRRHPEEEGASSVLVGVDAELYDLAMRWDNVRRQEANAKRKKTKLANRKKVPLTMGERRERNRLRHKAKWDAMTPAEKHAYSAKQWAQRKANRELTQ